MPALRTPHEDNLLHGLGASAGVYEGPARRVSGPDEFDRIKQGDVLVTESTSEAFNILLPLLGAIVTDSGGLLSHSAIVAREYGIPGVVGTREATERIPTGRPCGWTATRVRWRCRREQDRLARERPRRRALRVEGGRAGEAARAGLPLPPGVALAGSVVEAVASGEDRAMKKVAKSVRPLRGPFAVRSSAVDEDSAEASFAGQHLTLLNVPSSDAARGRAAGGLVVGELGLGDHLPASGWACSPAEHRGRRPGAARPRGRRGHVHDEPVNGADERVIEAAWGLGEAVVAGLVIPDHYRLARSGEVLERKPGVKKIAIAACQTAGPGKRRCKPSSLRSRAWMTTASRALNRLADRCEQVYGAARDIEWAIAGGEGYLLQCRAVTRAGP